MTPRYEVIENRHWEANNGRTASLYGAVPWVSEGERLALAWHVVSRGFTIRDNVTNTIGLCLPAFPDRDSAQREADKRNDEYERAQSLWRERDAKASAPIDWQAYVGNDGCKVYSSGFGYLIRKDESGFVVILPDGFELFPMRTLAKAKAWCFEAIRRERLAA